MTATPVHLRRLVQRDMVVTAVVLATLLIVTWAVPAAQLTVESPSARVAVETLRLCVVGLTALVLSLPFEQHGSVVRNAFVAALAVIAAASALFAVVPAIVGEVSGAVGTSTDGFYPWLGSRYVAGLLFVSAGAQWPRLSVRTYVAGALVIFVVLGLLLSMVDPPARDLAGAGADVTWLTSLEVPPLLLFAFGSWLAARLAIASGAPLERWLALSLLVGVFTQLQAVRQPELLGPVVTTTDVLRVISTVLLLVGAALQVRQMSRDRVRVVRLQRRELEERDAMVGALSGYVAREETFRAIVHHELATPIATIRAYAYVLDGTEPEGAQWRGALDGLVTEAEQLHILIARVDELRSLEATDFSCTPRPVRALPLLRDVARFARALPGPHEVDVRADDVRIMADPVRLGQALRNVASNAVRYSPDGGRIDLIGEATGPERYRVLVVDQGIGIDPDTTGTLLALAGRGRNATGVEGTGIGLYVARRITEAHGGRISIEPNVPAGTRVVIEVGRA